MKNSLVKIKYLLCIITILASNFVLANCFDHELKKDLLTDDKYVCGTEGIDYQVLSPPENFKTLIEKNSEVQYYSEVKDDNGQENFWFKNINQDMENPWEELAAPACQDREVFVIEELKDGKPTGRKSFAIMRNDTMYGRWRHCDWPSNIPEASDKPECDTTLDSSLAVEKIEETIVPIQEELVVQLTETKTVNATENEPEPETNATPGPEDKSEKEKECEEYLTTPEGTPTGEWDGEKCVCVEGYANSDKNDETSWCDLASFGNSKEDGELTAEEAFNLFGFPKMRPTSTRPNPQQMQQPVQVPSKVKRGITRGYQ